MKEFKVIYTLSNGAEACETRCYPDCINKTLSEVRDDVEKAIVGDEFMHLQLTGAPGNYVAVRTKHIIYFTVMGV